MQVVDPGRGYNRAVLSEPDLHGHTALVTGAGRRLGRAFAEALAAHGASVAVHFGLSAAEAEGVVEAIRWGGGQAVALGADLAQRDEARALVERAAAALGDIDLLVNNASIFEPIGVAETTPEAWDRHLAINLTAPFLISQAFARHRAGRPGAIVNLLDWRALRPGADHFPYTVAKAALASMTRGLAVALAPSIRVNGLALGAILPPPGATEHDPALISAVPLARWGRVDEVVHALLFLLGGPDFITGAILHLDGGRHLV